MFLHGGWMHLIGNMVFLWIYGNNVEDYFGPVRFVIFYLASGMAAIVLYTLFNPGSQVPLVGASGAIAGVMGAYMVLHPRAEITCLLFFFFITFITLSAKVVLGLWFFYQVLMSVTASASGGGVAWLAHVGGFAFGWGLLRLLVKFRRGGYTRGDRQQVYRMQW
jgi:membrane associated rhomboid family serine protease